MRLSATALHEAQALSEAYGNDNFMQSAAWGEFKRRRGHRRLRFRLDTPRGSIGLLGITRTAGRGALSLHVPFGPELEVTEEDRGPALEAVAHAIAPHLSNRYVFLRFDLPWPSPYAEPEHYRADGRRLGPPGDRLRELRMNVTTDDHNLRKAPTDLNPPDTVLVDLRADEHELLARMRAKTRYNIRLAGRRGVTVTEPAAEGLTAWYELYRETTERQGIVCEHESYFRDLFTTVAAGEESGDGLHHEFTETAVHLYSAWRNENLLGGIIVAHHRRKAYYLFGASASQGREHMPAYALQWHAMRRAKAAGCVQYDMFGIPPTGDAHHPMHGLYRFKTGFGGLTAHYSGTWDYPFDPPYYTDLVQHETVIGRYHT